MSGDCLKLTTYFGERDRTPEGPLADRLLEIYAAHRIKTSILLRGAEGFGAMHHLHTDRLLTLSEDLPALSIAIGPRERIEALLDPVVKLKREGLVTLERVRMLGGEPGTGHVLDEPGESSKLTVYLRRQERIGRVAAFRVVCDLLHQRGIAGASVFLGVDGTRDGRRYRARFFSRNADVPLMIVANGSSTQMEMVRAELCGLLRDPLMTLERVRICKRDGKLLAAPDELPRSDEHGFELWQKLVVYTSQSATHEGHPIGSQLMRRLREADVTGATSVRGIWGFHGDHQSRGDGFFQVRRHVPVVTIVIDAPKRVACAFQIIDELTGEHGLVTSEMVPTVNAPGERVIRHSPGLPGREP